MIIRNFEPEDLSFLDYELDAEQHQFTRLPKYSIAERNDLQDTAKTPITILSEKLPVGYFVLDEGSDIFNYTTNERAVLIRSVSLNPAYQGRGIAKQAMLDITPFVRQNFINKDELVLGVNFRNKKAYQLYTRCNFEDCGGVTEGRNGPLHILVKKI